MSIPEAPGAVPVRNVSLHLHLQSTAGEWFLVIVKVVAFSDDFEFLTTTLSSRLDSRCIEILCLLIFDPTKLRHFKVAANGKCARPIFKHSTFTILKTNKAVCKKGESMILVDRSPNNGGFVSQGNVPSDVAL